MSHKSNNRIDMDDWAYMVTVLSGPFSLLVAALLATIAAFLPIQPNQVDRSKDLMQFATLLFGGGAAVTGTTQFRKTSPNNHTKEPDTLPLDNAITAIDESQVAKAPDDNSGLIPAKNHQTTDIEDWAYIITVLSGPFSLLVAAMLATTAAFIPIQPNQVDRSKDLTQFATLLFGGGAAVTGTTQPRRKSSNNNANGQNTSSPETNNSLAAVNHVIEPEQSVNNSHTTHIAKDRLT